MPGGTCQERFAKRLGPADVVASPFRAAGPSSGRTVSAAPRPLPTPSQWRDRADAPNIPKPVTLVVAVRTASLTLRRKPNDPWRTHE